MRVERLQSHAVIQNDAIAVDPEPAGIQHFAVIPGTDGSSGSGCEIKTQVNLLVHVLAFVNVSALIGESRLHRRID